jgi:hypothetical protein
MQKIPVFQTVGHAYGFAFGRYLATLSIIWLPLIVLYALAYFLVLPNIGQVFAVFSQIMQHPTDTAANNALIVEMNRHAAYLQLFNLIQLAISVMILSGITKEVLGLRTGSRLYYLQFGSAELQVLVALILMVVIIFGVMFAVVIGGLIIGIIGALLAGAAAGAESTLAQGLVGLIAFVAAFCVSFYVLARALFLLVPASVAENSIAISRSWQLSHGNVWRIFGALLLALLPIFIIELVVFAIFVLPIAMQLVQEAQSGGQEAVQHHLSMIMQVMPRFLIVFAPVAFLLSPIFYGLWVSLPAFAYRALVPASPKDAAQHF